jgi:hypothetical protein
LVWGFFMDLARLGPRWTELRNATRAIVLLPWFIEKIAFKAEREHSS